MNHPWWDKKDNDASDVTQLCPEWLTCEEYTQLFQ